ncbi:MAG: chromate transporter [Clostridiales bacterium]|nr:chromate transporter [Clostridiales bacterium]
MSKNTAFSRKPLLRAGELIIIISSMTYLYLIYEFVKTGLLSIGGGLATLPFLYDMADRRPWFDRALLTDMIAVSESTPGPIGINMATFAGYRAAGIPGGIVASLALILPSVVIVAFVSRAMDKFTGNRFVKSAFYGLRPCVAALIASAGVGLAAESLALAHIDILTLARFALFAALLLALRLIKKTRPLYLFTAAAVAGVLLKL